MEIEIVAFYEKGRGSSYIQGSLHVSIASIGVEIRGIFVTKKKDRFYLSLPSQRAINEEGKTVSFPVFNFTDKASQAVFWEELKRKGLEYINAYLLKNPEAPISAKQDISPKLQAASPVVQKSISQPTATPTKQNKGGAPMLAKPRMKVFMDPPPRKQALSRSGSKR